VGYIYIVSSSVQVRFALVQFVSARVQFLATAYKLCYRPSVRLSVRMSVTRVDQSKTVKVKIMQLSPQSIAP